MTPTWSVLVNAVLERDAEARVFAGGQKGVDRRADRADEEVDEECLSLPDRGLGKSSTDDRAKDNSQVRPQILTTDVRACWCNGDKSHNFY